MIKPYLRRVLLLLTLSAFFVVPSVFAQDADMDGLLDSQEQILGTNPNSPDSDGDLVSDYDEVNANPPTDPNDPSKYPNSGITRLSSLHALPVPVGNDQSVSIDESFAPFGHRPDRDKVGDDGSSVIIDRNGVLIWANKSGTSLTIPNSSAAKTLHVSNTECLVYNNRYTSYNNQSEKTEIVIYRRGATGGILSSKTVTIDGTVLDTASVTPTVEGYMLVSGRRSDDGTESTLITQGEFGDIVLKVDQWDLLDLSLHLITWDGTPRWITGRRFSVAKNPGADFTDGEVLGYGNDGSLVINMTTSFDYYNDHQSVRDDLSPGKFVSAKSSIWISAYPNKEDLKSLPTSIETLAYVDNSRVIGQSTAGALLDYRNGTLSTAAVPTLQTGESVLPFSTDSIKGLSPYIYTIDAAGTSLRLYRADVTIAALGNAVTLPFAIQSSADYVRNPRDGSLLIKGDGSALIWVPTTTSAGALAPTGLDTPRMIHNSDQGKPLFVTARECVVWLNSDEPAINGSLPNARISHFQIDTTGQLLTTNLTPPMAGKYVVMPNRLTPDPELEGWYLTTYEKNGPASTYRRTYQLQFAGDADRDQDGISDYDEMTVTFTDPGNPDSDGDGLLDGQEERPYQIVTTTLSWEAARLDAISKGGRLAVLDTQLKQDAFKAAMQFQKADGKYWIGGHDINDDVTVDGIFKWLDANGQISGPGIIAPKNWDQYQPSNLNNADGMEVTSGSDYKWSMAQTSKLQGYVIEFAETDPKDDDSDNDNQKDGYERANGTNPKDDTSFPTHTLTLANAGVATGGTFSKTGSLAHGTNATLTAVPATGYVLQAWTGDLSGSTNPSTLLMNSNKAVGATFAPDTRDSDSDGLSNYDELVTYLTNPNDATSVPTYSLTLANAGVATGGTFGKTSGSLAHGATATFTAVPAAGYVFQAWTGDLSGSTNPSTLLMNSNKAVGATFVRDLADDDSDGLSNYDELVTYGTKPKSKYSDEDGFSDGDEINIYKTNPNNKDTDGDGLNDDVEVNTYKTSPLLADTDGDGLSDKEEVDGTHGFKSSPLLVDTDGDLVSDFDEVNATQPTDPNDPSKYPSSGITRLSSLHALPVAASAPASVAIDESFAPYGHRPDRDKVGDDGSSVIIDRNGVLIWTNKQGGAVTVPGASLAKTLYVSNTECVVYNNRFASTYNSRDEKAELVIHRRGATGPVTSSKTITVDGTVVDTCPVTPTTYGFTILAGVSYEDGDESKQITNFFATNNGTTTVSERVDSVDQWDVLSMDLMRITWDGQLQLLKNNRVWVPNNISNVEAIRVKGYGSDGSFVFEMPVAAELLDRYDDAYPGTFLSSLDMFWVSSANGQENIQQVLNDYPNVAYVTKNVAYVTNDRAVIESPSSALGGSYQLNDLRLVSGDYALANTLTLPAGDRVLPVAGYTIDGLPPYVYTIDTAGTSLRLYKADASLSAVGAAVTLPAKVKMPFSFVRNPRDGSLLIQSEDRGLMWIPTTTAADSPVITGLGTPQILVNSVEAKPLFVAAKEAVAWLNGKATVINGSLPAAQISHYQFNDKNSLVVASSLTPPMEGKYVVLPNPLTPDPDLEGWYVTTFEKNAPASTLMRTYQLQVAGSTDRDQDGISDYDEMMVTFTDPGDPDTDGDGLLDGQEVRPYQIVTTALSWEAARLDAISKGGRLAVLDTQLKQDAFKAAMQFQKADGKYWIGGHDITTEGDFQWLDAKGEISVSGIIAPKNWDQYQPSNLNNADGMEVTSGSDYKWSMAQTSKLQGYVIEFAKTEPNDDDSDNDGYSDGYELANLTNPKDVAAVPTYILSLANAGISTGGTFSMASGSLAHGTTATLTAAPATGYVLQAWTGDLSGSTLTKTLLMNGNKTVGATFVPDTHDSDGDGLTNYDELVTYHTDPNNVDVDGDGLSDGAEIKNIGSDPNNQNDVLRPSGSPFTNYKVAKGDYWGLVYDPAAGVLSSLKLTLTSKGRFSATMLGYPAMTGAFSAGVCNMAYSGADMASVSMTLQQLDGGCAMVGSFSDVNGKKLSFVLRRAVTYRKCNLTFAASPIDAATAPTGSAVATGAIAKGKVSFMVYLPNGAVQSFSGAVVGGNRIPLFTGGGGLAGELSLRPLSGSDFDGKVNFQGYNQLRNLTGSFYVKRSKKDLPLNFGDKKNLPNNTLFQWSGGSFNGSQLVGTWTPKTLTLSTESSQQANATLNAKTGLMGVNYYNGSAWATGKAVVLQASNAAKGFYTNGPDWGSLVIEPNHNNILPAAGASLSGASYSGSKAAATVTVTVYAAGAWNVDLKGVTWVTASTSSGSGNGTVTLTLAANATGTADRKNRSATISIAGQNYTISQTWD